MNINIKTNFKDQTITTKPVTPQENTDNDKNFSSELDALKNSKNTTEGKNVKEENETKNTEKEKDTTDKINNNEVQKNEEAVEEENIDSAVIELNEVFDEINKLNHKDDKISLSLKYDKDFDDINNKKEDSGLIDNNMNIQEPKEKLNAQMGAGMQFNSNSQPFAEFIQENKNDKLKTSAGDIAEEKAIMSTMEENIAIANKNIALEKTKTISDENGIKKVDTKNNITVDTIVKYDTVIMDKADVEFFTKLLQDGALETNQLNAKSIQVSKTLADLLAKAMENNKPVRIDFDNDISVIIRIDRAGKISADFLPSSQVAEAYLKENLPLLKQRFDENNIDYNELNQRKQKQDTNDNRKKERRDE